MLYYFIVQVLVFIILSFKFWFLVVHGVCHLGFGGGNPHVKYLCAVANFCDEYYLVIGPFCILSTRRVTPLTRCLISSSFYRSPSFAGC